MFFKTVRALFALSVFLSFALSLFRVCVKRSWPIDRSLARAFYYIRARNKTGSSESTRVRALHAVTFEDDDVHTSIVIGKNKIFRAPSKHTRVGETKATISSRLTHLVTTDPVTRRRVGGPGAAARWYLLP